METFKIYSSGEIVRDTGLLYFYRLLREIDGQFQSNLQPKLTLNYLECRLPPLEELDIEEALFRQIIDVELYQTFIQDLSVEKIDAALLGKWKNSSLDELRKNLTEAGLQEKQIEKIMKKSTSIYFPYLRNSGKFGANAQSIQNFHRSLKELVHLFFEKLRAENQQRQLYKEARICGICHLEHASVYDITHKYAPEIVDTLPESQRIYRRDSKYLFTFQGSEHNTFTNYADYQQDSSICFSCEFFNLFFLIYIKKEKAKYLVSCQNLVHMEFLQRKIRMKQDLYSQQAFYYQVAKSTKSARIRLYQIAIDANKGILLKIEDSIDFKDLLAQIKLMDFVDSFIFPEERKSIAELKQVIRRFILNKNNEMAYQNLLGNLMNREVNILAYNWFVFVNFTEELIKEGNEMAAIEDLEIKKKNYLAFGKFFNELSSKEGLAFQLTQMVKREDRKGVLDLLEQVYLTNTRLEKKKMETGEKVKTFSLPTELPTDILYSSAKEFAYVMGYFMIGLLSTSTSKKKGSEA